MISMSKLTMTDASMGPIVGGYRDSFFDEKPPSASRNSGKFCP